MFIKLSEIPKKKYIIYAYLASSQTLSLRKMPEIRVKFAKLLTLRL